MKAKYEYQVVVQEARATQCSELEESEAAYSEAIRENAAAKSLKCAVNHSDYAKLMHELERQALDAENNSCQHFLLTQQTTLSHAPQSIKEDLHSCYQILLGQSSSLWQCTLPARVPQTDGQPPAITSPKQEPKRSPPPIRQHSSTEAQGDTSADGDSPMASQEGPSSSKIGKMADWFSSLSPSCADAFCWDSSLIKEARAHCFTPHPWDWAHGNMDSLSKIFQELVQGAGLLGESIHELQQSWNGPEDLKHGNYVLQSLPKGLKFLRVVSTKESPKIMGLKGIHDSNALWHFASFTYCPWCGEIGQNEGTIVNHLRMIHYKLGLICDQCYSCPTVMSDTLC